MRMGRIAAKRKTKYLSLQESKKASNRRPRTDEQRTVVDGGWNSPLGIDQSASGERGPMHTNTE
jgi:hypothetical protein